MTTLLNDSAISFITSELNLDSARVGYKSGFTGGAGKFAYVKQFHVCLHPGLSLQWI